MALSNKFFNEFEIFDATQWQSWLDAALSGNYLLIPPERDEDIDDYVIRIFKGLSLRQKDIFVSVLGSVISHCPLLESYAKRWFALLKTAQVAKPPVQGLLRTLLASSFGNTAVQVRGKKTTLEATLLLAVAKYGVDDWLLDYIWKASDTNLDFEFGLLCMRILSWRLDTTCLTYHSVLIPRFATPLHKIQYQPEFYLVLKRLGCRLVMTWFQMFIERIERFPANSANLWSDAFEAAHIRYKDNPYALTVLAELRIRNDTFDPDTLSELSQVQCDLEPDLIPIFMLRIKDKLGWEYNDPRELAVPEFAIRNVHEFQSKSFNSPLKAGSPELELLDRANLLDGIREMSRFGYVPEPTLLVH